VKIAGKFDYKMLMKNKKIKVDKEIIEKYEQLDRSKKWMMKKNDHMKTNHKYYVYQQIRNELLEIHNDIDFIVDVLVKYLYGEKCSKFKETLWWSFGDVIIKNLQRNLLNIVECVDCSKIIENPRQRQVRCDSCQHERDKDNNRKRQQKFKNNAEFLS
jgi:hypothetical protein